MNKILELMIEKYNPITNKQKENVIKEVFQEIALSGLSRGGFFDKAAFYGGTCLRIFYGLDRFSEDLDFALINKNGDFNIEDYFPFVKKEFRALGLDINIEHKIKKESTSIESAFINSNTLILMMDFYQDNFESNILSGQKIKIKFEIDLDNPSDGQYETKYKFLPSPYEVKVFDESSLFSGKIAAILCRDYKFNVKGRDYYDYLYYISRGSRINLKYLEHKLKKNNKIEVEETLTIEKVKTLLRTKFENTNYELAIKDVSNFIDDIDKVKFWKKELFLSSLCNLKEI